MTFEDLKNKSNVKLYAGTIYDRSDYYQEMIGLSLDSEDDRHIKFDITNRFLLNDNSIELFQAEDVLEHIYYDKLPKIIDEIYRVLKPGGIFRLSVPDYNCDLLFKRCVYSYSGDIVYDPGGGGTFENPGHVWFPTYENVKRLLEQTKFFTNGKVEFLHYYLDRDDFVIKDIDYSLGYIKRTPDNDERVMQPRRPMSIVVDLHKGR